MEEIEKALKNLIALAVEEERREYGKRFSSYHEGHAYVHEGYDELSMELGKVVEVIDQIWLGVKARDKEGLKLMTEEGMSRITVALWYAVRLAAIFEKLRGGVVHEPK